MLGSLLCNKDPRSNQPLYMHALPGMDTAQVSSLAILGIPFAFLSGRGHVFLGRLCMFGAHFIGGKAARPAQVCGKMG